MVARNAEEACFFSSTGPTPVRHLLQGKSSFQSSDPPRYLDSVTSDDTPRWEALTVVQPGSNRRICPAGPRHPSRAPGYVLVHYTRRLQPPFMPSLAASHLLPEIRIPRKFRFSCSNRDSDLPLLTGLVVGVYWMADQHADLDKLPKRATEQDPDAIAQLMTLYRHRIRKLIAVRLDPSIAGRVDPSDVVQETLTEAVRRLPDYQKHRPTAFYPWLRGLALERITDTHRRHLRSQRRTVHREFSRVDELPDESKLMLAQRLAASGTSPSQQVVMAERRDQVRRGLAELPKDEREVLVLRYLEELDVDEIALVLEISERTVWRRHRSALEHLMEKLPE